MVVRSYCYNCVSPLCICIIFHQELDKSSPPSHFPSLFCSHPPLSLFLLLHSISKGKFLAFFASLPLLSQIYIGMQPYSTLSHTLQFPFTLLTLTNLHYSQGEPWLPLLFDSISPWPAWHIETPTLHLPTSFVVFLFYYLPQSDCSSLLLLFYHYSFSPHVPATQFSFIL